VGDGGCFDSTEVRIEVLPTPVADFLNTQSSGCVPLTVSFSQAASNGIFYSWNFGDGSPLTNVPQPTHVYDQVGTYQVQFTAVGIGGCEDTDQSTTITVAEPPRAEFVSDPTFPAVLPLPNGLVHFQDRTDHANSWMWDFGDGVRSSEPNPSHTFTEAGTYQVSLTVSSAEGCMNTVTHGPYVIVAPDLFIPNVFSPNGDGVNDLFVVNYTGDQAFTLTIMDRWGVNLYQSNNKTKGWDGKNQKSQDVTDGVYYYVVTAGTREFTGTVTLVR
jgi:gliding motility-associated-like protein